MSTSDWSLHFDKTLMNVMVTHSDLKLCRAEITMHIFGRIVLIDEGFHKNIYNAGSICCRTFPICPVTLFPTF